MRYHALACDYDGTIAWDGAVSENTVLALEGLRKSGRKLILVTGRELDDLIKVFPRLDLFDRVVAENGALLYRPATRQERPLAERPPDEFWQQLIKRGAERVSVGRVIVATWRPHETTAVELIRDLGLELHVIFNKGAVMILPSGVNKATGLNVALEELGLSPHNVVGVGDAENDHAFLALCECSVAVENALDTLKERVDWVTKQGHGDGTAELCQALVATDLSFLEDRLHRRKYAEGELTPDLCFYFRGPDGKLNAKAQNLAIFLQIAEGVADETWLFHLKNGDISRWFRNVIKDPELALQAELMERGDVNAEESRKHIRSQIEHRYILAA
ncbi:MAG TPA: HAD family hydrolase [Terriglobia bacterium]|nr:HAD family hydrolase [Terriglobia bacterium]